MSELFSQAWGWWVVVAIVFAIIEIFAPSFAFLFGAIGALVAALIATKASVELQILGFAVATLVGFVLLRPRLVRHIRSSAPGVPGRTDSLIGKAGVVVESIDSPSGRGRVHIGTEDWAATSLEPVPSGASIVVESADGIVLQVSQVRKATP